MNAAWQKLGGAKGEMGAPMAGQTEEQSVTARRFAWQCDLLWDRSENSFSTEPASWRRRYTAALQVPGKVAARGAARQPQATDTDDKVVKLVELVAAAGHRPDGTGRVGDLRGPAGRRHGSMTSLRCRRQPFEAATHRTPPTTTLMSCSVLAGREGLGASGREFVRPSDPLARIESAGTVGEASDDVDMSRTRVHEPDPSETAPDGDPVRIVRLFRATFGDSDPMNRDA